MRIYILIIFIFTISISAQEKGVLTIPIAQPALIEIEIIEIRIGRKPWMIAIYYTDNLGKQEIDYHTGLDDAGVMVKALNKANLSIKSLECRAIEHLVTHKKIPPTTCTGTPE